MLLEIGFLKRVRESDLWPRVGWVYGTSAGALAGVMAALDRLDDLEQFCLDLEPDETFRPNRLWQLPLTGLHDYTLPETIADRLGSDAELATALAEAPIELVVCVTDVGDIEVPAATMPSSAPTRRGRRRPSVSCPPCSPRRRSARSSCPCGSATRSGRTAAGCGTSRSRTPTTTPVERDRRLPLRRPPPGAELGRRRPPRRRLEPFRAVPPVKALIGELEQAEARWNAASRRTCRR